MKTLYQASCSCGWTGFRFVEASDTKGRKCRVCGSALTHTPVESGEAATPDGRPLRWSEANARWEAA